jgi:hypothetical protein
MFFSPQTPQAFWTSRSASERRGNGRSYFSLNFLWASGASREMPRTTAFFLANAATSSRKSMASWVQPEVIAFG